MSALEPALYALGAALYAAHFVRRQPALGLAATGALGAGVVVHTFLLGMATVRDQVVLELADVADAISEINQSYSYSGITGHSSSTAGTGFRDEEDFCEREFGDQRGEAGTQCVVIGPPGFPPE